MTVGSACRWFPLVLGMAVSSSTLATDLTAETINREHGLDFECPCSVATDGTSVTATFGLINMSDTDTGTLSIQVDIVSDVPTVQSSSTFRSLFFDDLVLTDSLEAGARLPSTSYEIGKFDESFRRTAEWFYEGRPPEKIAVYADVRLDDTSQDYYRVEYEDISRCGAPGACPATIIMGGYAVDLTQQFAIFSLDYLEDTDADGVGDLNERIVGTNTEDPDSTPSHAIVDVLAYYGPHIREVATAIQHSFATANTILRDSGAHMRFRPVGIVPCSVEPGNRSRCLFKDELESKEMERHGADMGVFFKRYDGEVAAGWANLVGDHTRGNLRPSDLQELGGQLNATITTANGKASGVTLAHELGHVMGLVHDVWGSQLGDPYYNRGNRGAWRWSRGHAVADDFATVMSYGHPNDRFIDPDDRYATRLGVFANPDLNCRGNEQIARPCGVDRQLFGAADAKASLEAVSYQYSAIRQGHADTDDDGFVDPVDDFPDDPSDWLDTDQDGVGNLTDNDDDGDGVNDERDPFPVDGSEWADTDRDGIGNNADTDDDNDGLPDTIDLLPFAEVGPEYDVPLFPAASGKQRQGFVRLFFPGPATYDAKIRIGAGNSAGQRLGNAVLTVKPGTAAHFNSEDLRTGNAEKGLTSRIGPGDSDWRLELLEQRRWAIEVFSYVRTTDGFLTAMHDLAPKVGSDYWVATFNPGSNRNQVSSLRLVNPGVDDAQVRIWGIDDDGDSPGTDVLATIPAITTLTLSSVELEAGGSGFEGALGDGEGKWRLLVNSDVPLLVMSLLESPTGHLTNLSSAPSTRGVVPLFPAAGDPSGRQGFVRVINHSSDDGEVAITAYDDAGVAYGPVTLALAAEAAAHFNSEDLEWGYPAKGLSGRTGGGDGDWRLELSSDLDIEVLSYIRTTDGFLTTMHDIAPVLHNGDHRVVTFNPGENRNQVSKLRLLNQFEAEANVVIQGVDDQGKSQGTDVVLSIPPGKAMTVSADELEAGSTRFDGALGDGAGKWRLHVQSDKPIMVMGLLESPTGHLTNLSAIPGNAANYKTFTAVEVDSEAPQMVEIPAGRFQMGCEHERCQKNSQTEEQPVHEVRIPRPFALSKYEITFAQWDACVADDGCNGYVPDDEGWGRGNRPVINVSWDDAQSYVDWLSQSTGEDYRLPTEAEWEYAARAGSTTLYSWGDELDYSEKPANCRSCGGDGFEYTAPVGSFRANAWGLHDVHGNVEEWVQDCWHDTYDGAPNDGTAWEDGCTYSTYRVARSGFFGSNEWGIRSAARVGRGPVNYGPGYRTYFLGFRIVKSLRP